MITIRDWGLVMQPRQIARPTSFGPEDLRVIFKAYDDAWSEIAPKINTDPAALERARMSLATIVLGLANAEQAGFSGLGALAVAVFCNKHRLH
jgi:hypothetical protein